MRGAKPEQANWAAEQPGKFSEGRSIEVQGSQATCSFVPVWQNSEGAGGKRENPLWYVFGTQSSCRNLPDLKGVGIE